MAAYELGKALLYVRSILWDLDVPQEAASRLYEDNDACTAMANAQNQLVVHVTWTLDITSSVNGSNGT